MSATRVVQWATGTTGRLALRAVVDAPDLQLVGVRVYDSAKLGMDAGELVDRPQYRGRDNGQQGADPRT